MTATISSDPFDSDSLRTSSMQFITERNYLCCAEAPTVKPSNTGDA